MWILALSELLKTEWYWELLNIKNVPSLIGNFCENMFREPSLFKHDQNSQPSGIFNAILIASVVSVFTNNASAKVIERAKNYQIPVEIFSKNELLERKVLQKIKEIDPDLIVLAGFLLKFPENIIEQ